MIDWTQSMSQTYEFYKVNPETWTDTIRITTVTKCNIKRDMNVQTLGSASITLTEPLGECYIRIYLIAVQNGERERVALGTYLFQPSSSSYDGKYKTIPMDGYTPLMELKENMPPLGYSVAKQKNIMDLAGELCEGNMRGPIISVSYPEITKVEFVANTDDTWLSFISDFINSVNYTFMLDGHGVVMFAPKQDAEALQPVWTYTDDNSSILQPSLSINRDIYGIPNVVEVVYSGSNGYMYVTVKNEDTSSPTSIPNRGRQITQRITNPELPAEPTYDQLKEYAERTLSEVSTVECSVTYTHGYCPVRIGDCVRLNYRTAGFNNVKAKVVSQSITCGTGCMVEETATFVSKLWR